MPERRKLATQTTRKGQVQGQETGAARLRRVAAQLGVAPALWRLAAFGSLDDPEALRAFREFNDRGLWDHISPAVQEALAPLGRRIQQIVEVRTPGDLDALYGHSAARDAVLMRLLEALELRPLNPNFFSTRTPLQYVNEGIEWDVADFRRREPIELRERIEELRPDAERARKQDPKKASEAKTSAADKRAMELDELVRHERAGGKSLNQAYRDVARKKKLKNEDVVENSIDNWKRRQRQRSLKNISG